MKQFNNQKNFIPRNDGFACEHCQEVIPPARGTFRNHCPHCLISKHVDDTTPGDRASRCRGLMPTVRYEGVDPDKLDLIQECQRCRKQMRNRTAPDDNIKKLFSCHCAQRS